MDIRERRDEILRILNEKNYVTVEFLASALSVSLVTIRTDLDALERKGDVIRTHGGAMLTENKSLSRFISKTINEYTDEKDRIAKKAVSLLKDEQTVIVDSGSTTVHVTKYLSGKGITMITGSILAIENVADDDSVEVLMLGGMLRRFSMGAIGTFACRELAQIHADILFMGGSGYTSEAIYCSNVIEAETKQAMISSSSKVCFLADSSKEGRKAFANVCDWSMVDYFVTDRISDELRSALQDKGVEILLV